ncbi:cytochrome P450 [Amycolatopsis sp.]|jgi:unspecific monooxygenase|uniref:cytochrome P450 n=1 Tax=Amycolatopsis sp. TaxID=37632 RepID=UPI002E076047|nr:cytochrome P450 [Amycolatopsis sp.]
MDTTGIPHPPRRVPFLGDVLGVNPRTPVRDTVRLGRELGPIFTRKVMGTEIVFVSDAAMVAQLNDETKFTKHVGLGVANLRAIAGDGLFTAHTSEPNWRLAHDILQPAFTLEAMRGYHPIMAEVAADLVKSWDAKANGDDTVDVAADMTKLTLETIGRTGFGYRFSSFERERPHPFVVAMTRALRYAQLQSVRLPFVRRAIAGTAAQNQADIRSMNDLVDEVIAARRPGEGEDLLALMLASPHPVTGERLDPVNIRNQVITFIVAGHETTSGALSFALYYLTRNPRALAAAREEVDAMWGDQLDPEPTFTEVTKLRYVRRVLDESMRLWPTAPGYLRGAREDVVLGGRYPMRKGDHALVMLPLLHRDPAVWGPDPEAFDPDRFAPGEARKRPAHAYKPFGTGERACIGRQFAIHEAVLALGLVLHRYEFVPDPAYELRIAESLTLKTDGFRLALRLRAKPAPEPAANSSSQRRKDY